MCCPTGCIGTNINPELMRIAVVIETLKTGCLNVRTQVYVSINKIVNQYLQKNGAEALLLLVDGRNCSF